MSAKPGKNGQISMETPKKPTIKGLNEEECSISKTVSLRTGIWHQELV